MNVCMYECVNDMYVPYSVYARASLAIVVVGTPFDFSSNFILFFGQGEFLCWRVHD